MPHIPSRSPITGQPTPEYYIHTTEGQFVDNQGRTLLLRGVNLSGDSKAPVGVASHNLNFDAAEAGSETFIGRPLRLEDADVHLSRLQHWGMNMLRYVIPWEALEHEGPGMYDEAFIDYTISILQKCKAHGFRVWIDPHQDVWSRFSGGSGAPIWTFHACGLNPRKFAASGSLIHSEWPDPLRFPIMSWPTSYYRLPTQTPFTLFWAGRDFAPKCIIDGQNIQDYLQSHFIEAFGHLADCLRDAGGLLDECVIGWENMNEPSEGYIGIEDLNQSPAHQILKKEASPTPAQGIRLGSGIPQVVDYWSFSQVGPIKTGTVTIDPKGQGVWLEPSSEPGGISKRWKWRRDESWKLGQCIWAQHGIWDEQSGEMMVPDYFAHSHQRPGHKVDFVQEYWLPHWKAWGKRIRQSHPEAIHFIQPPLFTPPPQLDPANVGSRACYSPHYYDGLTMMTRKWNWFNSNTLAVLRNKLHVVQSFKFGEEAIRKNFQEQLAMFRDDVQKSIGDFPVMIGETGTPFDMDNKKSYGCTEGGAHTGKYVNQTSALDASLNAADGRNLYNWTIWSYCTSHSWEYGDGWNGEDLSIWSPDDIVCRRRVQDRGWNMTSSKYHLDSTTDGRQPSHLNGTNAYGGPYTPHVSLIRDFLTDGARALDAFCRPYPIRTIGRPKEMTYKIPTATFLLTVVVDSNDGNSLLGDGAEAATFTEIFVPLTAFSPTSEISHNISPLASLDSLPDAHISKPLPLQVKSPHQLKGQRRPHHSGHSRAPSVVDGVSKVHHAFARYSSFSEASSTPSLPLYTDIPLPLQIPSNILAIDVAVSHGEWYAEGQLVRWKYPIPEAGSPRREYSISIRRHRAQGEEETEEDGCIIV